MKLREKYMHLNDMLYDSTGLKEHEKINSLLIVGGKKFNPTVSVMIPTYRRLSLLKEAINSVINQINFNDFEIVIVDNDQANNNDMDLFVKELNFPRLSLYRNEKNIGMIGNWNKCIQLAKANWIVILHDDDQMKPNALFNLVKNINGNSLVAGSTEIFGVEERHSIKKYVKNIIEIVSRFIKFSSGKKVLDSYDIFVDCPICASGALLNRQACIDLGGYSQKFWPISDYLFSLRYILKFGGIQLKQRLIRYRLSINESNNPKVYLAVPLATYELRVNYISQFYKTKTIYKIMLFFSKLILILDKQIAFNTLVNNNSILLLDKNNFINSYKNFNKKILFPSIAIILTRIFLFFFLRIHKILIINKNL